MKAFMGKYYTTAKEAVKAYYEMSDELQKTHAVCSLGNQWFIVSNSIRKAFNKKK